MYLITRARARAKSAGQPLKPVFRTLAAAGVHLRRSQLVLIAAAPGGGKSALASTFLLKSGADGIYFSADSDEAEQYSRSVCIYTGLPMAEVLERMDRGDTAEYDKILTEAMGHIRLDYEATLSLDHIEDNVRAYAYLYGHYPTMIVVDNLRDVISDEPESYLAQESILAWLKDLARTTKSCVIVLAHVTGEWETGDRPIPLSGLRGKVGKIPQIVLTLFREANPYGGEDLGVAIVKNRGGRASASGQHVVYLDCDFSTMTIKDKVFEGYM